MTAGRPEIQIRVENRHELGPEWQNLRELIRTLEPATWTLVGGLMVQLHGLLANLPPSRATNDIDLVLHLETGATSFAAVVGRLGEVGYTLEPNTKYAWGWCKDE